MMLVASKSRFLGHWLPGTAALFCAGLLSLGGASIRAEDKKETPSYFVFPVTSQLQRDLIPSKADLMVFVDATSGLFKDGALDDQSPQLGELRKKLQPLAKKYPHIQFTMYRTSETEPLQTKAIDKKVADFAKEMGFQKTSSMWTISNDETMTWAKYSKPFMNQADEGEGKELPVVDGVVKLYPVKTTLSRWLTSNADWVADLPAIAENENAVSEKVTNSLKALMKGQKITPDSRIQFRQENPGMEKNEVILKELFKIGEGLGFKHVSVTYS